MTRTRILTLNKASVVAAVATTAAVNRHSAHRVNTGARVNELRAFKGQCYQCGGLHIAQFCKEKKVIVRYRCGKAI